MSDAAELRFAGFVFESLANRTDAYGTYRNGFALVVKEPLTAELVAAHFRGEIVVGVFAISRENTCLWVAWDFDNHGGDPEHGKRNLAAAWALFLKLGAMGLHPMLEDSDGQGGYHVWLRFTKPVPSERAFAFARHHCPEGAEFFPKQPRIDAGGYGNWMRLPGHHPRRDHRSRMVIHV